MNISNNFQPSYYHRLKLKRIVHLNVSNAGLMFLYQLYWFMELVILIYYILEPECNHYFVERPNFIEEYD